MIFETAVRFKLYFMAAIAKIGDHPSRRSGRPERRRVVDLDEVHSVLDYIEARLKSEDGSYSRTNE